jgi:hypothetical protein
MGKSSNINDADDPGPLHATCGRKLRILSASFLKFFQDLFRFVPDLSRAMWIVLRLAVP